MKLELALNAAENNLFKGFFLGATLITFVIIVYLLVRQKRYAFLAFFVLASVLIQVIYLFGEMMAGACYSHAHWSYYAYEFLAFIIVFCFMFALRNWRWRQKEIRPLDLS